MVKTANSRQTLGKFGESAAARYLENFGLKIVDRNWRSGRAGEVDLIALDGPAAVFVEVKTRRGVVTGLASEAVDGRKLARMQRVALSWMAQHGWRSHRFDVVGVYVAGNEVHSFEWLRDVAQ